MDTLEILKTRRENVFLKMQNILDTAQRHNRDLSSGEQSRYGELQATLTEFDAEIEQLADLAERNRKADEMRSKFNPRPGRSDQSAGDADIERAFRSAIVAKNPAPIEIPVDGRSYYQPGVERRDLLKTTSTQALRTGVYGQIVQHMVENSAVLRAGATVLNTPTGEDLQVPKSTAFSTSLLTAEGASITESDPTLAVVTLKSYKYATFFQVSHELANDSGTDLMAFLARQAGESLALAYGDKLINGTGTSEPRGVLTDAPVGKTGPTGTATSFGSQGTAGQGTDLLYDLHGSLAEPYTTGNGSRAWVARNATFTTVRKLKDSQGQPVLPADGVGFLGAPFVVDPFVPAQAANAKSLIYGDWSRYFVRIAEGLRFERSNDFAFQNDLVTFRAIIRIDGALCDNNSLKAFQHSAT